MKWPSVKLSDCMRLINGRAYLQHELLDEGTPIIRIQNLNGGDRWYYSDLILPENKYCINGDLLFAWSATFGPYIWEGDKSIYHYHIWKIEPYENLDKRYAYHILLWITNSIKRAARGASMLHMTKAGMEQWEIPLPPLAEQKRIAALLDTAVNIMRLREQTIAKLDSLVESTFFKLFGNAKNNEMSWNTVPLGDLCDVEWGNTSITKASYVEHGFPAYSAAGSDGYLAHAEHTGDGIVLSAIGARCGKCFRAEGEWTAIKNTITIKTKSDEVDIDFLFQILNDENFWEIRGAGQPFITLGTARKLKVITPPKKLQSKFVNMYEEIKNQRKNFESSHMKLTEAFSSLQHQSFAVN